MLNYLKIFFRNFILLFPLVSLIFSFELVGVLVEFQPDFIDPITGEVIDDPETSGNGQFLTSADLDLGFIQDQNISKCKEPSFIVDKPPHDADYFLLQMLAVKNYYNSISDNAIDFEIGVIDEVFQLDNNMKFYSTSDSQIGLLFSESIDKVNAANLNESLTLKTIDKNINNSYDYDTEEFNPSPNILYVVFHAGLGQESSTDFDPTIYDIRSAFVDDSMLDSDWVATTNVETGIVMPETLNMIYYDVIEDAIPTDPVDNIYCNQQFGMTGLFAYLLGYSFGFPPLHNFESGNPRVGVFDLMDIGFFNGRGVIPAPPSAWIRTNENFNFHDNIIDDITENISNTAISYQLPARSFSDKVYKIKISNDEYFLIENRIKYLGGSCEDSIYETQTTCEEAICPDDDLNNNPDYCNWNIVNTVDDLYDSYVDAIENGLKNDEGFDDLDILTWISTLYPYDSFEAGVIPGWFDVMENMRKEYFEIDGDDIIPDSDYNVITSVDNYDSGLPGSGLLIWHINEPIYNNGYEYGINNDLFNKAIALEEGDGSVDIGDLNLAYGIWSNEKFISGNQYDLWRDDNDIYMDNNYINEYNNSGSIYFNSNSFPDSRTNSGVFSNVSLRILSPAKETMEFEVKAEVPANESEIIYLDETYKIIGNNGNGCVYFSNTQNQIFQKCSDGSLDPLYFESANNQIVGSTDSNNGVSNYTSISDVTIPQILYHDGGIYLVQAYEGYYFDEQNSSITNTEIFPMGKLYSNDFVDSEIALSLGNIDDNDSYHEILYLNNGNLIIENYNGSSVNGFPLLGNYSGIPLILNINNESDGPEIICVNDDKIDILSNKGNLLYEIPYFGEDSNISTLLWGQDDIAIVNGYRLYIFENVYDEDISYWMNSHSKPSNYPIVTGNYIEENNMADDNIGIDLNRVYNFPNPIQENSTRFRFYVYTSNSLHIDIYDIAGYKVKTLFKDQLAHNEFNEILWESINLSPGLYFASVKSDTKQSKVLKVVIQ